MPAGFGSELRAHEEAAETQVWAEIAMRCRYFDQNVFREIDESYEKVLGQIVKIIDQPEKWLIKPRGGESV